MLEEDEEERKEEVLRFKELKRPAKRKQDQAPTDWENQKKKKRKIAETPTDRVDSEGWKKEKPTAEPGQDEVETQAGLDADGGEASQESTSVKVPTEMEDEDEPLPESRKAEAADRLEKLRKRMLEDRLRVINYLERKKEDETITEIGKFWEEQSRKLSIQDGKEKAER